MQIAVQIALCLWLRATSLTAAAKTPHLGYFIVLKQIDCQANPHFISHASCTPEAPLNRSIAGVINTARKLNVLSGSLQVSIPNSRRQFQVIYKITFDICKVLRERQRKALIALLETNFARGSTKPVRCPFAKGNYHSENITMVDSLPSSLTESDFLIHFSTFVPKIGYVLNITSMGRLHEIAKQRRKNRKYL